MDDIWDNNISEKEFQKLAYLNETNREIDKIKKLNYNEGYINGCETRNEEQENIGKSKGFEYSYEYGKNIGKLDCVLKINEILTKKKMLCNNNNNNINDNSKFELLNNEQLESLNNLKFEVENNFKIIDVELNNKICSIISKKDLFKSQKSKTLNCQNCCNKRIGLKCCDNYSKLDKLTSCNDSIDCECCN